MKKVFFLTVLKIKKIKLFLGMKSASSLLFRQEHETCGVINDTS